MGITFGLFVAPLSVSSEVGFRQFPLRNRNPGVDGCYQPWLLETCPGTLARAGMFAIIIRQKRVPRGALANITRADSQRQPHGPQRVHCAHHAAPLPWRMVDGEAARR